MCVLRSLFPARLLGCHSHSPRMRKKKVAKVSKACDHQALREEISLGHEAAEEGSSTEKRKLLRKRTGPELLFIVARLDFVLSAHFYLRICCELPSILSSRWFTMEWSPLWHF